MNILKKKKSTGLTAILEGTVKILERIESDSHKTNLRLHVLNNTPLPERTVNYLAEQYAKRWPNSKATKERLGKLIYELAY